MSRLFTDEELRELGTLTIDKLKAAADQGDAEKAKALADKMYGQLAFLHDGYMCWISGLLTWIYEHYGIEKVEEAEKFAHTVEGKIAFPPLGEVSVKESVEKHCDALMGHVFQPITVTEDDEKVIVSVHPCGSGGRLMEKGGYEKGLAVLKEKCPLTWGIGDLPIYCCHCPATEMLALEGGGDLRWVHPTGESGKTVGPNCEYWMYKNPEDIPEEYYTRLGKKRPQGK